MMCPVNFRELGSLWKACHRFNRVNDFIGEPNGVGRVISTDTFPIRATIAGPSSSSVNGQTSFPWRIFRVDRLKNWGEPWHDLEKSLRISCHILQHVFADKCFMEMFCKGAAWALCDRFSLLTMYSNVEASLLLTVSWNCFSFPTKSLEHSRHFNQLGKFPETLFRLDKVLKQTIIQINWACFVLQKR